MKLILITEHFPYGASEAFLEVEKEYYDAFDKVHIYPIKVPITDPNHRCEDKPFVIHIIPKVNLLKVMVKALSEKNVREDCIFEIKCMIKKHNLGLRRIIQMLQFAGRGNSISKDIEEELKNNDCKDVIIYSYWMVEGAYAATLLKRKNPMLNTLTRCHGFDLYEERRNTNYIPLRQAIMRNIDLICCISENGKQYVADRYNRLKNITVEHLGTLSHGIQDYKKNDTVLRVVSCSSITPVKRIHLLLDALKMYAESGYDVEWTHFGDGILKDEILESACDKPQNFKIKFKGNVSNAELLETYSKNVYDVFVNVSESEGIPVSIMEAVSFGIPVIATDVGGTSEIVHNGINGFLLKKEFPVSDLYGVLKQIFEMAVDDYMQLRKNARNNWEKYWNADENYSGFINKMRVFAK